MDTWGWVGGRESKVRLTKNIEKKNPKNGVVFWELSFGRVGVPKQMNFRKTWGGASFPIQKIIWNFSENSSVLVALPVLKTQLLFEHRLFCLQFVLNNFIYGKKHKVYIGETLLMGVINRNMKRPVALIKGE